MKQIQSKPSSISVTGAIVCGIIGYLTISFYEFIENKLESIFFISLFIIIVFIIFGSYYLIWKKKIENKFLEYSGYGVIAGVIGGTIGYLTISLLIFLDSKLKSTYSDEISFIIALLIIFALAGCYVFWKNEKRLKVQYFMWLYLVLFVFLTALLYYFLDIHFYSDETEGFSFFLYFPLPLVLLTWKFNILQKKELKIIGICYVLHFILFTSAFILEKMLNRDIGIFYQFILNCSTVIFLLIAYFILGYFKRGWSKIIFGRVFVIIFVLWGLGLNIMPLLSPHLGVCDESRIDIESLFIFLCFSMIIVLIYFLFLLTSVLFRISERFGLSGNSC